MLIIFMACRGGVDLFHRERERPRHDMLKMRKLRCLNICIFIDDDYCDNKCLTGKVLLGIAISATSAFSLQKSQERCWTIKE